MAVFYHELLQVLPRIFDLRAKIAPIAVLHDDAKVVFSRGKEGVLVADDIRMVQPPQEIDLLE